MRRTRERKPDNASPDFTPMIDVTFQLLIFFILCTRFAQPEKEHRVDLPHEEGNSPIPQVAPEGVTIYCIWDEAAQANHFVLGIDGRGRIPVEGSYARLSDLVIYANDPRSLVAEKRALYKLRFEGLVAAIEAYIRRSGAAVKKLEISFAVDGRRGAVSNTAPWLFVSLALDCCVQVNSLRVARGRPELAVTFKFADALGYHR